MALKLFDQQTNNVTLGSYFHSVANTALYSINAQVLVIPQSSVSIAMAHNGVTIVTSAVPSATQNHIELSASDIDCTAGDALTVSITSTLAKDSLPQAVKGTVQIGKVIDL